MYNNMFNFSLFTTYYLVTNVYYTYASICGKRN